MNERKTCNPGKETDGNFSILPVAIRIFQGTKKLVIKMLWVSCIDIISRSGDGAFFQTVDAWTLSPDWKSANLHSFPTGKHAFISMNHSASRFYLLLNLSCFTAFAAPLPEEHTSSMTTFSRVQLPISRPQPNIAFQAYNF